MQSFPKKMPRTASGPWIRFARAERGAPMVAHMANGRSRRAGKAEVRFLGSLLGEIPHIHAWSELGDICSLSQAAELWAAPIGPNGSWVLHREDGPAVSQFDFYRVWCLRGLIHREGDLPAIEPIEGYMRKYLGYYWFRNGRRHRDGDKPAEIRSDGRAWYRDGIQWRANGGPAVEMESGELLWIDRSGEIAWSLNSVSHEFSRSAYGISRCLWYCATTRTIRAAMRFRVIMSLVIQMIQRGGLVFDIDETTSSFRLCRLTTSAEVPVTKWRHIESVLWLRWIESHADERFPELAAAMRVRAMRQAMKGVGDQLRVDTLKSRGRLAFMPQKL
jgi:hypothetical protein